MPFIPNKADAFSETQASVDSGDLEVLRSGSDATGTVTGCLVSAQGSPDMTVAVASGVVSVAGSKANVAAGNVTITVAHATLFRHDLIVVNSSGTKSAIAGTPAAEMGPAEIGPVFPAIPAASVVLAAVYVPAADTDIDANQITDKRVFVNPIEATTNYDLAKALGLPLFKERGEVVTLASGQNIPHGMVMVGDRLFMTTLTIPTQFIRFNDLDDLTDRSEFTFPADGFHDDSPSLVYVAETNRLYVLFQHASRTTIAEVHPDTLATTDVISDTTHPEGGIGNGGSICSDGTNLYVCTASNPANVLKYQLSDFTFVAQAALTKNTGHGILYDGVDVFAVGGLTPAWIARVDPTAMTAVEADITSGFNTITDDMASIGDNVWVGTESPAGLFRIDKGTLTTQTRIYLPASGSIWGLYYDNRYLWVGGSLGALMRVDPESGDVASLTLPDTGTSEIASDSAGRLFVAHSLSPIKIRRIHAPGLTTARTLTKLQLPAGGADIATTPVAVQFVDHGTRSAGASEVALTSVGIGANQLAANKQGVRLKARGRFGATANTKRIKVRLGSTDLYDSGLFAFNGTRWTLEFELIRTGVGTQDWSAELRTTDSLLPMHVDFGTATADETILNILATRAIGGTASDVQQEAYVLEMLN